MTKWQLIRDASRWQDFVQKETGRYASGQYEPPHSFPCLARRNVIFPDLIVFEFVYADEARELVVAAFGQQFAEPGSRTRFYSDGGENSKPPTMVDIVRMVADELDAGRRERALDVLDETFLQGAWDHIFGKGDGVKLAKDVRGFIVAFYREGQARRLALPGPIVDGIRWLRGRSDRALAAALHNMIQTMARVEATDASVLESLRKFIDTEKGEP